VKEGDIASVFSVGLYSPRLEDFKGENDSLLSPTQLYGREVVLSAVTCTVLKGKILEGCTGMRTCAAQYVI
jgi:hypothetical protein